MPHGWIHYRTVRDPIGSLSRCHPWWLPVDQRVDFSVLYSVLLEIRCCMTVSLRIVRPSNSVLISSRDRVYEIFFHQVSLSTDTILDHSWVRGWSWTQNLLTQRILLRRSGSRISVSSSRYLPQQSMVCATCITLHPTCHNDQRERICPRCCVAPCGKELVFVFVLNTLFTSKNKPDCLKLWRCSLSASEFIYHTVVEPTTN